MGALKLSEAQIGKTYSVDRINLKTDVRRRFEILGMTGRAAVTVMNRKRGGAMIIRVRGTRFAIGKEFAEGIILGGVSCDERT